MAAYTQLTGTVTEYFQRAVNLLRAVGRHVRLSSPLPIVFAVDRELWREQAVRMPEWERDVLRQQSHTIRIYLRVDVDVVVDELRRRLCAEEMDLLHGGLLDSVDAYERTVKRLGQVKGSHPDDFGASRREEKAGTIRKRLASILAKAESEPVPALSTERLAQLQSEVLTTTTR